MARGSFNGMLFSSKLGKHEFGKQTTRITKHILKCHGYQVLKIKWQGLEVRIKTSRCRNVFVQTTGNLWGVGWIFRQVLT